MPKKRIGARAKRAQAADKPQPAAKQAATKTVTGAKTKKAAKKKNAKTESKQKVGKATKVAQLKTAKTSASVSQFLESIHDPVQREDCAKLVAMMEKITGDKAAMWGNAMVGFGKYRYRYESGREGDWFETGFSPRKQNLSLYIMVGIDQQPELLAKLGPHKTGKSCLYVKKLDDIHLPTLRKLIQVGVQQLRKSHKNPR